MSYILFTPYVEMTVQVEDKPFAGDYPIGTYAYRNGQWARCNQIRYTPTSVPIKVWQEVYTSQVPKVYRTQALLLAG